MKGWMGKIRKIALAAAVLMLACFLTGCCRGSLTDTMKGAADSFGQTVRGIQERLKPQQPEEATQPEPSQEEYTIAAPNGAGAYTVLLIGSDRRDNSWYGNGDCMMLLSVNYYKHTISLVSLMRDTGANVPGRGYTKMNSALAIGGPDLAVQTIAGNFQVGIDGYIFTDFPGMIRIIDLFGGVTLDVSDAEAEVMNKYIKEHCKLYGYNFAEQKMPSGGHYTLNGVRAVAYCRVRYVGNGDFERTARQRRVLSLLYEKMSAMSLAELTNLAQQVLPSVQTNIGADALALLIPAVTKSGYTIVMDRIPYDGLYTWGQENLDPIWPDTIARLQATLY